MSVNPAKAHYSVKLTSLLQWLKPFMDKAFSEDYVLFFFCLNTKETKGQGFRKKPKNLFFKRQ